ncbi:MAG: hypothetical protein GWN58_27760 [Anaerolineae bacterium]|nr:hypothetical protein [Anaerolineae bacterium]
MAVSKSISFPDDRLDLIRTILDIAEAETENSWSAALLLLIDEALEARKQTQDETQEHRLRVEQALTRIEQRLSNLHLAEASSNNVAADQEAIDEVKKALF